MATEIAKQLIYNLRNDNHVREHFSIRHWEGKGTCGTVGCIAGTALVMARLWEPTYYSHFLGELVLDSDDFEYDNFTKEGQKVLGLEFRQTAMHLFIPDTVFDGRAGSYNLSQEHHPFLYLSQNAQPQFETIEAMLEFYKSLDAEGYSISQKVTPDRAAHALEQVTVDEIPYVDWKRAFEEA